MPATASARTRPTAPRRRRAELPTPPLPQHSTALLRQARKHAERPDDAEEALQRACLLFLERYHYRHHPLAWLQTTVKREAWAIARRSHRRRERGFDDFRAPDGTAIDLSGQL